MRCIVNFEENGNGETLNIERHQPLYITRPNAKKREKNNKHSF